MYAKLIAIYSYMYIADISMMLCNSVDYLWLDIVIDEKNNIGFYVWFTMPKHQEIWLHKP